LRASPRRLLGIGWVALCLFGIAGTTTARAQTLTPEVSRGLIWLQGQVQPDGSLSGEATSVATGLQNRAETAQTLKALAVLPANLTDAIAGEPDDNTEYLARRIVSLALAGRDASTLLTALAARQNADGGFGGGAGYDSNALDTAWALIALRSASPPAAVTQALGYLGLAQAFDGSYSAPGRPDVETTAVAVLAQAIYASQFNSFAAISRAVPYLLAQQDPVQQWGNSFLTATVYGAIHDFVPLEPTATSVRAFLVARQGPDGSWDNGDPFSTALALRAIVLSTTAPANPTLGIIRGRVIDSQTRLNLDGVTVALSGPSNPVPATTSGGAFEFRDLFPGAYTLQLSLNQYGVITFSTTLQAGQTLDFGAIALTKNGQSTTGTVRGTVTDATTRLPLAGASVSLSSGESATTDSSGSYQIADVAPANLIVVANRSGYASAPASVALVAGGTVIFSPALVPTTQSVGAAIEGVISDAASGAALEGATISVTGSAQASTVSDAQGHYRIAPLTPGVITVSVVRAGYRSATSKVTVVADTTLEYSPALQLPGTGTAKLFAVSSQGDQSTNQIFRYELAGPSSAPVLSLTLAHPTLDRPSSLAFRETGEMFVVNRGAPTPGAGSFLRFSDPGGAPSFVTLFGSSFVSGPQFATFKGDELFVAQRFGGNVLRFVFDSSGNPLGNGIIASGLASGAPRGIAANPATGELFVSQCCGVDQINRYVFDAGGNAVPNGSITGGGLNSPQDMAFSARGELFVANAGGNSVSRFTFDASGNAFPNGQITGNGLNAPAGLDFSPWGELFVASGGAAAVSRFTFDAAFNAMPNGSFATPATLGDIQFLPSGPGIRGVALDASTDQPIAGVLVQAIVGNATRSVPTGADGRFELDGLPAGQAQITFTLNGYFTQNLALELSALTDIDIGAVRMRVSGANTFLPDLVVRSVDTQQVVSDPRTFALSGSLAATIANQGTAPTTAGFKARAFYDVNRNGIFDPGVDSVLGDGQAGDTLAVNATAQISIPLSGSLPFRDAPIQVWADSEQSVVESNELNNVGAAACQVTPAPTFVNIAPTRGIASTNSAYQPAIGAIDNNFGTLWNAGGFGTLATPYWLVVDLRSPVQASSIQLWSVQVTPDYIFLNTTNIYNLYVGNDGVTWTKIASGVLAQSDQPQLYTNTIPLAPNFQAFRYVKYEVVGGTAWAHLFELQVWTTQQAPPVTASDLTASALLLTDLGSGQLRLSARIGNGGATASPATTASFYDGDPAQGGALIGSVPVAALQPGQFVDVNLVGALAISGSHDLFTVVDPANQIAECRETNNTISAPAKAALSGGITAATDASTYGAQTPVRISAVVGNTSPLSGTFNVATLIEDASGAVVATFPPHTGIALAAGANTVVNDVWNTGSTFPGAYQAKAQLLDDAGQPYASASAPFSIGAGAVTVSAKVSVDKTVYLPSDTVQITSRLANLTENQPLDNLTAVTTVSNPDGTPRFTQTESIPQLAPSALRDLNYALPLAFAPSGAYSVSLNLSDSLGALLASSSTTFTVGSSAVSGSGLTGTLSATPKPVPFGDPIAFNASIGNVGNADIPVLAVKVSIVDPAAERVLAEFPATLAVPQTQTVQQSFAWPANAAVGGTYVAVLSAIVGSGTITLAQEAFTIAPPVTRVAGTITAAPKQVPQGVPVALSASVSNTGFGVITALPIQVTVANSATGQVVAQFSDSASIALAGTYSRAFSWPATGAVGTGFTVSLGATINGVARTLAQDSFSIIAPPVQLNVSLAGQQQARVLVLLSCQFRDDDNDDRDWDHDSARSDADKPSCIGQKSAFLASYLSGLGLNYLITSKDDDFTRAFRSGQYNTYWITGGAMKLDDDLTEEIREAVFRGDALVLDAVHDERNHGLDAVAGTNVHGKLSVSDAAVSVTGPLFAAGTLPSTGRPLQLDLTTGAAQAVFAAAPARPAIVTNQYGLGRAVLFAYDLVDTLMTQPSSATDGLVSAAFGWLAPAPAGVLESRSYTVLRAVVTNVGIAADLKATFTPPAGATVLGTSPAATPDASGRPVWTFSLDSGATKNLDIALRLPANTGTFTANISINSTRNDLATPFSTSATLNVESADTVAPRVAGELAALSVAPNDKSDRDRAVSSIRAAQASLASGFSARAIDQLIDASEHLLKISSVDVTSYRVEVDRLLQEAEARWFVALP
jgi:hypothetical protein